MTGYKAQGQPGFGNGVFYIDAYIYQFRVRVLLLEKVSDPPPLILPSSST